MSKKLDNNKFTEKAKNIHGNLYDYSLVKYINNKKNVKIICNIHGVFEQSPSNHLSGKKCKHCSEISRRINKTSNTISFINKAKILHNDKYNYDKVIYTKAIHKVDIVCKKHGVFKQKPSDHLSGIGCPKCNTSKGELLIEKIFLEKNINYKKQFYFTDLKHKSHLKFDFAIFDMNNKLICLLEYNGKQHYLYRKQFNMKKEEFISLQHRDNLKKEYCYKNNISLVIIKYNENIIKKTYNFINYLNADIVFPILS